MKRICLLGRGLSGGRGGGGGWWGKRGEKEEGEDYVSHCEPGGGGGHQLALGACSREGGDGAWCTYIARSKKRITPPMRKKPPVRFGGRVRLDRWLSAVDQ